MGMLIYDALVLAKAAEYVGVRDSVLTLGVPTLNFNDREFSTYARKVFPQAEWQFEGQEAFFRASGFAEINALDISDYEGANFVGDLNDSHVAEKIGRQFGLVYDSGTIEHIFDVPTALRSICSLTRLGGVVVHATPTNGFMDHGFWQISPDLFRAFYRAAGFSILTSSIFVLGQDLRAWRAEENWYRTKGRKVVASRFPEAIAVFAARKDREVSVAEISMQDYYSNMHTKRAGEYESAFFIDFHRPSKPTLKSYLVAAARKGRALVTRS